MEVGFAVLGMLVKPFSRLPGNGDDDRVVHDDVDRYADSVKECSSAAVASRDSSNSPFSESLSSWTPTVQPER